MRTPPARRRGEDGDHLVAHKDNDQVMRRMLAWSVHTTSREEMYRCHVAE
jgi:hypothetical protein